MLSTEYFLLRNLLKGNYIKGANALESLLQEPEHDDYLTKSADAMRVIFEPMTSGGNKLLPDIFLNNSRHIGQGLRTYARLYEPSFDPSGILIPFPTISSIVADTQALIVALGNDHISHLFLSNLPLIESLFATNDSIDNMLIDDAFLTAIATSSAVADIALKNDYFVSQLLITQHALDILTANDIFMARAESNNRFPLFFDSALFRSTILKYPTIRRFIANPYIVATVAADTSFLAAVIADYTASDCLFSDTAAITPYLTNSSALQFIMNSQPACAKLVEHWSASGSRLTAALLGTANNALRQIVANSRVFLTETAKSSAAMTAIQTCTNGLRDNLNSSSLITSSSYSPTTTRTLRRSGAIYLVTIQNSIIGSTEIYEHYRGATVANQDQIAISNTATELRNPGFRADRFMNGIDNRVTNAGLSPTLTYRYIALT